MNSVFILWHTHVYPNEEEEDRMVGIFSSEKLAIEARERVAKLPGFRENKKGFCIAKNLLDKDDWTTGFRLT